MYPILFHIGPFPVRAYPTFIAVALLAGMWMAAREVRRRGGDPDWVYDFGVWAFFGGILGARLWEVAFAWDYYGASPARIFALWEGGLSIQGGIIGGLLAGAVFLRRRGLPLWPSLDACAPGVILAQAIGRLGACFLNGDAYGVPTGSIFGAVYKPGTPAYAAYGATPLWPAEVFEGIWDLGVLFLLLRLRNRPHVPGTIFLTYAMLYSIGRFAFEFLRGDSLLFMGLKAAQVTSVLIVLVALALLQRLQRRYGAPWPPLRNFR